MTRLFILVLLATSITTNGNISAQAVSPRSQYDRKKCVCKFPAMGVEFRIVAYASREIDFQLVKRQIKDRVEQLEAIFSDYRQNSEVKRLADSAPHQEPVVVSDELYEVCKLSQHYFETTSGAFDPSIGPLSQLWRFARKRNRIPEPSKVTQAFAHVGWNQVDLRTEGKIVLKGNAMQLDFGGIVKGFAADEVIKLLERNSITSALVDAGGDIRVSSAPPGEAGWSIATSNHSDSGAKMSLANLAVATSGSTKQRLVRNGKLYSHIIDPRNGKPVAHSINVTVIASDGAEADALASAFSILGTEQSLRLANASDEIFAMFVDLESGRVVRSQGYERFFERK